MERFIKIIIDRNSEEFIYIQLYRELARLIESGELKAYDKMPPIRKLSDSLEVNNVTVVNAYRMLEESGLVHKKVGSGTYVSPVYNVDEEVGIVDEGIVNFASTTPPIDLFPVDDFKQAMNEVLDRDGGLAFAYHEGKGYRPLREFVVRFLKKNGIETQADSVHVISGVQQGIDVVSKSLIQQGDVVFVEAPTYAGALGSFRLRGARIVEIPMTDSGVDLNAFEAELERLKPKLFYTMPNFHNPTGNTYCPDVMKRLVELSNQYGFYIIEDDYATDLSFTGPPPQCLKAFDLYDRVIYLKSFSKLFMPGLRLGFMISPRILEEAIMVAKHTSDISTSGFIQRVFDCYLRRDSWDRQFKVVWRTLKSRYDLAAGLIQTKLPEGCTCHIPGGGVNFWIGLPNDFDMETFYERLNDKGIRVVPGESFYSNEVKSTHFRLSVAGLDERRIAYGLETIFEIIQAMSLRRQVGVRKNVMPIM